MKTNNLFNYLMLAIVSIALFNSCTDNDYKPSIPVKLPEGINLTVSTQDDQLISHFSDAIISGEVLLEGDLTPLPEEFEKNLNVVVYYGTNKERLTKQVTGILDVPKPLWYKISVEFKVELNGLDDGAVYYYKSTVTYGEDNAASNLKSFFTLPKGPVDLDLASGNLWDSKNVGASYPEEDGDYYAWGDTKAPTDKNRFDWSSYMWSNGSSSNLTKYCMVSKSGDNGFTDGKDELDDSDDIGKKLQDDNWQMPTTADFTELIKYCTYEQTIINGISGLLFSSKKDQTNPKKKVFLPFAGYQDGTRIDNKNYKGYYWTRNLYTEFSWTSEYANNFIIGYNSQISYGSRCLGESIRLVQKK